jgi:hypothetical protein
MAPGWFVTGLETNTESLKTWAAVEATTNAGCAADTEQLTKPLRLGAFDQFKSRAAEPPGVKLVAAPWQNCTSQ